MTQVPIATRLQSEREKMFGSRQAQELFLSLNCPDLQMGPPGLV
jgi:hypothetical protein